MKTITYKDLILDIDEKCCFIDNEKINLSKNEYDLLLYLLNNKGKLISRLELSKKIWNNDIPTRTLDTTISRIRKKLKLRNYITTRNGFGYGILIN